LVGEVAGLIVGRNEMIEAGAAAVVAVDAGGVAIGVVGIDRGGNDGAAGKIAVALLGRDLVLRIISIVHAQGAALPTYSRVASRFADHK